MAPDSGMDPRLQRSLCCLGAQCQPDSAAVSARPRLLEVHVVVSVWYSRSAFPMYPAVQHALRATLDWRCATAAGREFSQRMSGGRELHFAADGSQRGPLQVGTPWPPRARQFDQV